VKTPPSQPELNAPTPTPVTQCTHTNPSHSPKANSHKTSPFIHPSINQSIHHGGGCGVSSPSPFFRGCGCFGGALKFKKRKGKEATQRESRAQ
jgi:hypothetical protein